MQPTHARRSPFAVSALLAIAGTPLCVLAGTTTVQPIALTGVDNAFGPGMGAGVVFSSLGGQQPSVNTLGQVAFRGNDSTAGTPQGMWIFNGTANSNVMIAGGAMPGGGTYTSGTTGIVNSTQLNSSGEWAFRMGASTGLFGTAAGMPTRVLLGGDTAPDADGATYASTATGMPLFNEAGQIGYIGTLTTGSGMPPVTISSGVANQQGIWTGVPGATSLAVRMNDPVLALAGDGSVRVGTFQNLSLSMNGSGRYAVISNLQGSVTTGSGGEQLGDARQQPRRLAGSDRPDGRRLAGQRGHADHRPVPQPRDLAVRLQQRGPHRVREFAA